MSHFPNLKKGWRRSVWPYLITASVTIIITLIVMGYAAYVAAGAIPLIGGAIRNKMRKKVGLPKEKVKVISPGRGLGNKERREN